MSKFNVVRIGRQAFHEVEAEPKHIQCFCFLRFEDSLVACENGQDALAKYRKFLKTSGIKPEHLKASTGSVFAENQRQYRFHHSGRLWELTEVDTHIGSKRRV